MLVLINVEIKFDIEFFWNWMFWQDLDPNLFFITDEYRRRELVSWLMAGARPKLNEIGMDGIGIPKIDKPCNQNWNNYFFSLKYWHFDNLFPCEVKNAG